MRISERTFNLHRNSWHKQPKALILVLHPGTKNERWHVWDSETRNYRGSGQHKSPQNLYPVSVSLRPPEKDITRVDFKLSVMYDQGSKPQLIDIRLDKALEVNRAELANFLSPSKVAGSQPQFKNPKIEAWMLKSVGFGFDFMIPTALLSQDAAPLGLVKADKLPSLRKGLLQKQSDFDLLMSRLQKNIFWPGENEKTSQLQW